jgi:ubiquinol-cytochrome c reductase cytochrome b/c1 subunit
MELLFFFFVVYIHLFKNANESESGPLLWYSGVVIFLLLMATAFFGYILPWGQMSFWGATVITNLFTTIPYVGVNFAQWLWGGFSVDNPTLNRFFSFHYCLPFVMLGAVFLHLTLLHYSSSTDEENCEEDNITFYPYYFYKDVFACFFLLLVFCILVFFYPNVFSHPDNYIYANITVTPSHLVPEWYFLPFYSILRSTPDKLGGLLIMLFSIFVFFSYEFSSSQFDIKLFFIPETSVFSSNGFWVYEDLLVWIFIGWLGAQDLEEPYPDVGAFINGILLLEFIPVNFFKHS